MRIYSSTKHFFFRAPSLSQATNYFSQRKLHTGIHEKKCNSWFALHLHLASMNDLSLHLVCPLLVATFPPSRSAPAVAVMFQGSFEVRLFGTRYTGCSPRRSWDVDFGVRYLW